ncbi:hypothetical protein TSOC_005320, partial [Tetrabaena socialis]
MRELPTSTVLMGVSEARVAMLAAAWLGGVTTKELSQAQQVVSTYCSASASGTPGAPLTDSSSAMGPNTGPAKVPSARCCSTHAYSAPMLRQRPCSRISSWCLRLSNSSRSSVSSLVPSNRCASQQQPGSRAAAGVPLAARLISSWCCSYSEASPSAFSGPLRPPLSIVTRDK